MKTRRPKAKLKLWLTYDKLGPALWCREAPPTYDEVEEWYDAPKCTMIIQLSANVPGVPPASIAPSCQRIKLSLMSVAELEEEQKA